MGRCGEQDGLDVVGGDIESRLAPSLGKALEPGGTFLLTLAAHESKLKRKKNTLLLAAFSSPLKVLHFQNKFKRITYTVTLTNVYTSTKQHLLQYEFINSSEKKKLNHT